MDIRKITFSKKPIPIPAEYRPMYQIAIMVLVLKNCCRGGASSLQKLHLFSWCLYSKKNMQTIIQLIENNYKTQMPHWTVDPVVNRALIFAVADGLCELTSNKKYKLTTKGMKLANKIEADSDLFSDEKVFLCQVSKRITDEIVDRLTMKK